MNGYVYIGLMLVGFLPQAFGQEVNLFEKKIRPFLTQYCVGCHGPEKQKAKLRLDTLDANLLNGNGTLLDNTLCFYGCATSKTHRAINYPIILSGGKNLGFQHGAHLNYSDDVPLSNLFVTIANQLSRPTKKFADSTADITEVLS